MREQSARPISHAARALGLHVGVVLCLLGVCASSSLEASELRETEIVRAVRRVKTAVVNIRGEKTLSTASQGPDAGKRVNGMGTGVVIDPRGYILTNFHVVDGVREIQVTLSNEKRYTAALVSRDLETDLAVIKIDAEQELPIIPVGTSSDLMPGETVIAVGNAYGYENTVTRGIVSALHRAVQVSDAQFYDDLIQTDASINPGNSGGPLLNIEGDMIGVNVAVRAGAQGIGFAIPVDKALAIAAKLVGSSAVKAYHGVAPATDTPRGERGVAVGKVESKSPAAEAGIEPGDVITAVGEYDVKRHLDFHRAMIGRKPGEQVHIALRRDGETISIDLTLGEAPEAAAPATNVAWESIGLDLQPIAAKDFRELYQTRYRGGLAVVNVRTDGPAAAQGIKPGDVLVGMHVWETVSLENVAYILKRPDLSNLSPVKFFVLRGNETLYGYMPLGIKTAQRP
jgi:serine protease Do